MTLCRDLPRILLDIFETLVGVIFVLPILCLIFAPLIAALVTYRLVILVYIKIRYPQGKIKFMSLVDSVWSNETPSSSSIYHVLVKAKGHCDASKIKESTRRMEETARYGNGLFRRKVVTVGGLGCWETVSIDEFDLNNHVEVIPSPSKMEEEVVFQILANTDVPFENVPPWKIVIFPNVKCESSSCDSSEEHYIVAYKIHHGYFDGISFLEWFRTEVADTEFQRSGPFRSVSKRAVAMNYFVGFLCIPRAVWRAFLYSEKNYKGGPCPELCGRKQLTWTEPVDFALLREIKRKTNTSIFSVILSSVASALRQLYDEKGELSLHSDKFYVLAVTTTFPYIKGEEKKLDNCASGVHTPAITASHPRLLGRVERLKQNYNYLVTKGKFNSVSLSLANSLLLRFSTLFPLRFHKMLLQNSKSTLTLSTLPGPEEPVSIYGGDPAEDLLFWVPIKYKTGLGLGLLSYKGRIRISLIADEAYFKDNDINLLQDYIVKEIKALSEDVDIAESMV